MKFLTKDEAAAIATPYLDSDGRLIVAKDGWRSRTEVFETAPAHSYFVRAQEIVEALGPFEWCLLWVVLTGVWGSSENLHLYYRFRESYGERTHVGDRPAVLALAHEKVDVVSFVHLGMLAGWEMYLVTSYDYGRAFVSHDGFSEVAPSAPEPSSAQSGGPAA